MSARLPSLGALLLLALAGAALLVTGGDGADERGPEGRVLEGRVESVTDGDTIRVLIDGRSESVRYIGIDTPESTPGQPLECFGKDAAERNGRLVAGRRVRLELGEEARDRYGRLLAYVYAGERFVNEALIRAGFARTLAIEPNTRFASRFDRLEQEAANSGRGLWGAC